MGVETVKKYLAIASIATACALLAGCSSDKADEIYARLEGRNPEVQSLAAGTLAADGLSDDQLPEGVEVALSRSALASNDLSLYDAPSPVGSVVGSVPAGERVQVTGVVRRPAIRDPYRCDSTKSSAASAQPTRITAAFQASPRGARARRRGRRPPPPRRTGRRASAGPAAPPPVSRARRARR